MRHVPEESLALLAVVIAVLVVGLRDQAEQRRRNRAGGEQGWRQCEGRQLPPQVRGLGFLVIRPLT